MNVYRDSSIIVMLMRPYIIIVSQFIIWYAINYLWYECRNSFFAGAKITKESQAILFTIILE